MKSRIPDERRAGSLREPPNLKLMHEELDAAVPGEGLEPRLPAEEEDPLEVLFDALWRAETSMESNRPGPSRTNTLSSLQERLWLVHQLDPGNAAYVMPLHLRLRGRLDTSALKAALQMLWRRHDTLRTVFPSRHGQPARVLLPADALTIPEYDLSDAAAPDAWQDHYLAIQTGPFKLEAGPLLRACIYRIAPAEHLLLIDIHHINADGVSLEILRGELFELYAAFLAGRQPRLPALGAAYADFIDGEAARRESQDYKLALEKRVKELTGAPTRIAFPFDKPIPGTLSHRGGSVARQYDHLTLLRRAFEQGRGEGLTPFMVILAAFGTLLHRHTGQDDLLIGIPTSLRQSERFERTVGFFVNTCVARLDFGGSPSLREVMRRARRAVREMLNCPDAPLDYLVRALLDRRTPGRPPLIQASLSFELSDFSIPSGDLTIEPVYLSRHSSMFELAMDVILRGDTGICHLEYYAEAWEEPSVRRMLHHFHAILEAMASQLDLPAGKVNLMSLEDLRQLATVLDGEPVDSSTRWVPDWIGEHARRQPHDVAIRSGGTPTSYSQLEELVALRRGQLGALGLNTGAVLALACAPGLEWTATALAAMAEGIIVLPLDVKSPATRLRFILGDAKAALVWHDDKFDTAGKGWPCPLLHCRQAPQTAPRPGPSKVRPDLAAYLIYTSGTTGQPKGVRVSHGAFETHCRSAIAAYEWTAVDCVLVFAPPYFDASWEQLFAPLVAGASVRIRDEEPWAPEECCRQIARVGVTCADLPPQYLCELLFYLKKRPEDAPRGLRMVISGGEAMPTSLAQAWLDGPLGHVPLFHVYGPTEAVVTSTVNRIRQGSRLATANGVVPIGKPMPGRVLRILNEEGLEVGAGMAGELCLGGPCLADGYQDDEARTRQAFGHWLRTPEGGRWVDAGTPGSLRLYRSGDRVRVGPDNLLEFLGRLDRQLKIRGFRVEPAEIETVLLRHPAIAQALVVSQTHPAQGEQLVAYCIPKGKEAPSPSELAPWLSPWLPEYMIPARTVFMPSFPTTASGKIDTAALPKPELERENKPVSSPSPDGLETKIAAIWAEVLGRPQAGWDDNFFDLGGHSLLLVRLHTRLVDELKARVRLVDLFAHPTVARMAKLLRGEASRLPARRRHGHPEGVAVIGMAGRFPGAANVDELWANLAAGKESIRFFTPEELAAEGVPQDLLARPGYVPAHGYLEGVKLFDAEFFGYSPKEAELIDPQQRLFLEEAWHALESAGYDPTRHSGDIAVFGGVGMGLYLLDNLSHLLGRDRGAEAFAISLANEKDFLTARVSYKLGLRGPSVNVNTACSTSLVAIHMAAAALRRGECDLALAGGVTLQLPPVVGYAHLPGGIASPDGHCRAFAEDAAGTPGGSGVAVVVLKRLEQALADGDTIRAVIKGSAINNDGADKVGFTAPGVHRQRDVVRAALDDAGVSANSIQYLEAHGTGTPMGDPIEIQALGEAFAPDQPAPQSCFIGSIKSNLGHLDTAAGVAGFIKTVLALEHGQIPPTLHCERPSTKIGFERTPFRVAQRLAPWPGTGRRRAGVSSFGMGGANAHVVLEEAPAPGEPVPPRQDLWCLPISARGETSLLAFAANLARYLEENPALDALDLWFTLCEGRRRFPARAVVLGASRTEAVAALRALRGKDLLVTDREGQILSSNGQPEFSPFAELGKFANALAFSKAWLTGELSAASALLPSGPRRRIPLPTYVFDRQVCWVEPPRSEPVRTRTETETPAKLPLDQWFYFPGWERLPARRDESESREAIVVLHGGSAVEMRWMESMRAAGIEFIACPAGAGLESALAALARRQAIPAQAWHLAALGFDPGGPADYACRLDALLADFRALAAARPGQLLSLLLLMPQTRGPDAAPSPAFAYLDAVCAVIPHEYGAFTVKALRLDPAACDGRSLRAVRSAANSLDGARILALWDGKLWRRTFHELPAGSSEKGAARLKPEGVYLVTGGLGGVGLALAGHLARVRKARLVLVSRTEPGIAQRDAIAAMVANGAQVRTAALDVADADALRALVDDVCARWGRIDGVIHATGIPGGSLVARTGLEEIERVLRAKVSGTEALALALREREPSFVVLCSSLTASLGGPGQVAYAAANAWLDAFATAQAVSQPGVWTAVEWDTWAEVGMAARAGAPAPASATGRAPLKEWRMSPSSHWPWGEHRIGGAATLPGTAYLGIFAAALGGIGLEFGPVTLVEPMVHDQGSSRLVQVLREDGELLIQSSDATHVREHARARIGGAPVAPRLEPLAAIQARCPDPMGQKSLDAGQGIVIDAGPRWAIQGEYWKGHDEALARLELPARFHGDLAEHPLHPALMDIAQSYYLACVEGGAGLLPWRYEKVRVFAPLEGVIYSHARLRNLSERACVLDADLRDSSGRLLVQVEGYTLLRVAGPVGGAPGRTRPVRASTNPFAMTPAEGIEVFLRSLDTAEPVVCVSAVAWKHAAQPVAVPVLDSATGGERARRARLPAPESAIPFRAAGTDAEEIMAAVWAEVLGYERIGIDDDLFDLGADSLTALQASARLKELAGCELSLEHFFAQATIANLAKDIPTPRAAAPATAALEAWEEGEL